jgi:prevent-host-death family protein
MKTVSIMEAQHNLSKVLRDVAEGQHVTITRRRRRLAEIVPLSAEGPPKMPDFAKRAQDIWGRAWHGTSSDELLDEARGNR